MRSNILFSLKPVVVIMLALTACAASCKRDGAKTAVVNPASAAAVKVQLDVLRDSVDIKWRNMIASDDQKIGIVRLLLRELKGQSSTDQTQLPGLERASAGADSR